MLSVNVKSVILITEGSSTQTVNMMMPKNLRQCSQITPTIYTYELVGVPSHEDLVKVGYTDQDVKTRVEKQLKTSCIKYCTLFSESWIYEKLYKKYNLTKEEIAFIESMVRPMEVDNE